MPVAPRRHASLGWDVPLRAEIRNTRHMMAKKSVYVVSHDSGTPGLALNVASERKIVLDASLIQASA